MKTEQILKSLKLKHKQLQKEVSLLTAKKEKIEKHLIHVVSESNQTEEAILALEGKTTAIKEALSHAIAGNPIPQAQAGTPMIIQPAENPQNGKLPPAEQGFKWAKNKAGEDILVSDNSQSVNPEAYVVKSVFLPPVEGAEEFSDPRDLIS